MEPITANITEFELSQGERIIIAPTRTKDIVQVRGSIVADWRGLPRSEQSVPAMMTRLMDAGTKTKTKKEIREALSARGISLTFFAGTDRVSFQGSCLPEDLDYLLRTVVEWLTEATFPAKELALAKERRIANLTDRKTDTNGTAFDAFSRMVYDKNHPYYFDSIDETIARTKSITRDQLLAFRKTLGRAGLIITVVGDVEVTDAKKSVVNAIKKLPSNVAKEHGHVTNIKKPEVREMLIPIKDKANIDVYMGAAIPITYDHPLYVALRIFIGILGDPGLSSGHLMRTIRERDGLTYGIYSTRAGFDDGDCGAFFVWATFSPATYERAIAATKKEIQVFLKTLLTPEALLKKQDQIVGGYLVGLGTTGALAARLIGIAEEGKQISYIDAYPDLVRAVTVEDLKAVAKLIPFDKLSLAASGTFQK